MKFTLTSLFVLFSCWLSAQNITAGYDTTQFNPAFIQDQTGNFALQLGAYTQFRYNTTFLANTPDSVDAFNRGFNLARTRIFMTGNMTPAFNYHFRVNINATNNLELMVAFLQWNIKKDMYLRMGKQFMPLGREDWMFPQDLAAIDFSAHDFTFAIWTSYGFLFHQTVNSHFRYWAGLGNGAYGSRQAYPDIKDSDMALTGRADWNITGSDWGIFDDLLGRKGRPFGMLLGVGIGHNTRYNTEALQTEAKFGTQLNLDYTVAGNGFQIFAQGSYTNLQYEDYSSGTDHYLWGMYANAGYWFSKKLFTYARLDVVGKGSSTVFTEDYVAPGIGCSIYPFEWTNRTRFTLEYNYLGATLNNTPVVPDGQLGLIATPYGGQQSIRFQIQFGF